MDRKKFLNAQELVWNTVGAKLTVGEKFVGLACLMKASPEKKCFEPWEMYYPLVGSARGGEKILLGLLNPAEISAANPFTFNMSNLYNFYGERLEIPFDFWRCDSLGECRLRMEVSGIDPNKNRFEGKTTVPGALEWFEAYRWRD
jgi:hypothetical protein